MADNNQANRSVAFLKRVSVASLIGEPEIDKPEVHMDRRGRLYVDPDELWRSGVFRAQLTEIAKLSEELRAAESGDKSE